MLVGRERKGGHSPAVKTLREGKATWRSARPIWGALSGQGEGFNQEQRRISQANLGLTKVEIPVFIAEMIEKLDLL